MKKIAIIGSINTDFTFKSKKLPKPSETIHGESFDIQFGGKGANEAVACTRLGVKATLFGKLGDDMFSIANLKNLKSQKVDISNVEVCKNAYGGTAGINIGSGTNSIVVVAGANGNVDIDYIERHKKAILSHDIFCMQLEIPFKSVEYLINMLSDAEKTIIFNPSPITKIKKCLLSKCSYVIVNEIEIKQLPGFKSEEQTLRDFKGRLILTHGAQGVYYYDNKVKHVPALNIKNVVDTTGAGDTFLAAFAKAISQNMELEAAIKYANVCAGLKTTKHGAQTGMPYKKEVECYIASQDNK